MVEKGKTILILGNGFDLAHGLPTKYSDFLEFCDRMEMIWNYCVSEGGSLETRIAVLINKWETDESIKNVVVTAFENRKIMPNNEGKNEVTSDNLVLSEIHNLLDGNVWYAYFTHLCRANRMKGENWIDFESEIRYIIKDVDEYSISLTDHLDEVIDKAMNSSTNSAKFRMLRGRIWTEEYIEKKKWGSEYKITVKDFREKAFEDIERLTRALELYLAVFVEKIQINKKIPEISSLSPDYVINFNYTDTYERIYKKGEVYHIHGRVDANRPAEKNDMVLGIDEYWIGDEQDERTNFTIFKKFAQRIQKHTGNESYKYLMEMQKIFRANKDRWSGNVDINNTHPNGVSYVYVFGHSLDVTDKDILSGFIGDDATSVTVYCRDKGTEGELIANTIKLITEKRLLEKVNHVPTKLKYIIP